MVEILSEGDKINTMGSEPKRMRAVIKDPQHFQRVADAVRILNLKQDLTDVCFVCARGQTVNAHKLMLCSVSAFLKEMILGLPDVINTITIHLPDIESRILRILLDFLYEGRLQINKADYNEVKNLMNLLHISLLRSAPQTTSMTTHLVPETQVAPSTSQAQPAPAQPVYYVQASAVNGQGQVQYMLATPQGQMVQMPSTQATGQVLQMAQMTTPATSMAQGQMVQMAPAVMTQAGVQMVQAAAPAVSSTVQQSNMVQVVSQNNTQVVPMVPGNQMVQCSNPMVMQGNQTTIINNSPIQGNVQNHVAQPAQRTQYVMASSANQAMSRRGRQQYTQPQTTPQQRIVAAARSRLNTQAVQPTRNNAINNVADGEALSWPEVRKLLKSLWKRSEAVGLEQLTVERAKESLENRFGCDLTSYEGLIEQELKMFRMKLTHRGSALDTSTDTDKSEKPSPAVAKTKRRKRKDASDDENDEDFDPWKYAK